MGIRASGPTSLAKYISPLSGFRINKSVKNTQGSLVQIKCAYIYDISNWLVNTTVHKSHFISFNWIMMLRSVLNKGATSKLHKIQNTNTYFVDAKSILFAMTTPAHADIAVWSGIRLYDQGMQIRTLLKKSRCWVTSRQRPSQCCCQGRGFPCPFPFGYRWS